MTEWLATLAIELLILGGIAVSEIRQGLQRRRSDRAAREAARNSTPEDVSQWTLPASQRSTR